MKIGDMEIETALPLGLDAEVRALTGYGAVQMRKLLAEAHVLASTLARALHPFLAEPRDIADLASHIAAAGVAEVQAELVKLYDEALAAVEAPSQKRASKHGK